MTDTAPGVAVSQVEANKDVVRRWAKAVWDDGDASAAQELQGPELVVHADPAIGLTDGLSWPDGVAAMLREALPDLRCEHELLFGEGDLVSSRSMLRGTHTAGPLWGQPPSGKALAVGGIEGYRVRDGQIVEIWVTTDWLGLAQQAGLVPDPGGTS